MIKKWRPDGLNWFRERADALAISDNPIAIYEAGANAMLEALRKKSMSIGELSYVVAATGTVPHQLWTKIIVEIPNDEVKDDRSS